jgi:hypothetical protein
VKDCIAAFYSSTTKAKYKSNDSVLINYITEHHPTLLNSDRKLAEPMSWLTVELFLEDLLIQHADKRSESKDEDASQSYFSAVSTAIKRIHEESGLAVTPTVSQNLKKFLKGYARQLAILRKSGKMKAAPGGDVIDFDLYRLICMHMWKNASSGVLLFHILLLNVGARSDNTSDINQTHIGRLAEFTTLNVPNSKVIDILDHLLTYMIFL